MKKKEKKNNLMLILGIMLIALIVTVGYASLQANLQINGTDRLGSATWNVRFDNIRAYGTGNVTPTTAPFISPQDVTKISYEVNISTPGDKYEFLVDVKNLGSIDAVLDDHFMSSTGRQDVIYEVTEYDTTTNTPVPVDDFDWDDFDLGHGETRTLLVSVRYDRDEADPDTISVSETISLTLTLDYIQA